MHHKNPQKFKSILLLLYNSGWVTDDTHLTQLDSTQFFEFLVWWYLLSRGRCGVNRLHANNWPASNDSMVHLWGADDYHQFSSRYTITEMSSCSSVASHKNDVTGLLACVASMIQPTLMWHSNEIENYWNWVELSRVGGNGKAAIAWEPGYTLDRPQICWSAKTKINLKLFSKKIKNKNNQNLPTIKT